MKTGKLINKIISLAKREVASDYEYFNPAEKNTSNTIQITNKWLWKMDYCKSKRLNPAFSWGWDLAEKAYIDHCKNEE